MLHCKGWSLSILQGVATHLAVLWHCVGGRGYRGNNAAAWLSPCFLSLPMLPTSKLDPSGIRFLVGWVCICFRNPWVSPTNFPLSLGVSLTATKSYRFLKPEILRLCFPALEPWVAESVSLPSCSSQFMLHTKLGLTGLPAAALPCVLSAPVLISASPISLDECFFFTSLVVRLPYSVISLAVLDVFFFLSWLLFFFLLCEAEKCICLHLHLGRCLHLPTELEVHVLAL